MFRSLFLTHLEIFFGRNPAARLLIIIGSTRLWEKPVCASSPGMSSLMVGERQRFLWPRGHAHYVPSQCCPSRRRARLTAHLGRKTRGQDAVLPFSPERNLLKSYIYIYIYTHVSTCIYIYIYIYTCKYMYIHVYIDTGECLGLTLTLLYFIVTLVRLAPQLDLHHFSYHW